MKCKALLSSGRIERAGQVISLDIFTRFLIVIFSSVDRGPRFPLKLIPGFARSARYASRRILHVALRVTSFVLFTRDWKAGGV